MNTLSIIGQQIWLEKSNSGSWHLFIKSNNNLLLNWEKLSAQDKNFFWDNITQEAIKNFQELENCFNLFLDGQKKISSRISLLQEKRETLAYFIRTQFDDNYKNIFMQENYHILFKTLQNDVIDLSPYTVKITKSNNNKKIKLIINNKKYKIDIVPLTKLWKLLKLNMESNIDYLILSGFLEEDWNFLEQVSLGRQLKKLGFN